jgi:hypothetical protein
MKLFPFIVLLILVCYSNAIYLSPLLVPQSHWNLPEYKFYTQKFDDSCESCIFKAQSGNRLIDHFHRLALQREGEIYETIAKKEKQLQKEQNLNNQEILRLESMLGLKEFEFLEFKRKHKDKIQTMTLQFNNSIAQLIQTKDAEVSRRIQSKDFEVSLMIESRDDRISKLKLENKKLKNRLREKKMDVEFRNHRILQLHEILQKRENRIIKCSEKVSAMKIEISKRLEEISKKNQQISQKDSFIDHFKTKDSLQRFRIAQLGESNRVQAANIAEFNKRRDFSYTERKLEKCLKNKQNLKEDMDSILSKFKNDLT